MHTALPSFAHLQGLEIPENHPFIDPNPDENLTEELVEQRLNEMGGRRRRRASAAPTPR